MSTGGLTTALVFDELPSIVATYPRMIMKKLLAKRPEKSPRRALPRLIARAEDITIDLAHLARYRALCGFAPSAELPMTYPHLLATSLQARLLSDISFPYSPLGIIHRQSHIEETEPIATASKLDFICTLGEGRDTPLGFELELCTSVIEGGVIKGHATTTVLWRGARALRPKAKPRPIVYTQERPWVLAAGTGRRYAFLSGDYNPVHLFALTARPFGYARPIAHGNFLLGRALAELLGDLAPEAPRTLAMSFLRPVLLPAKAIFASRHTEVGVEFALRAEGEAKHYFEGSLCALAAPQV